MVRVVVLSRFRSLGQRVQGWEMVSVVVERVVRAGSGVKLTRWWMSGLSFGWNVFARFLIFKSVHRKNTQIHFLEMFAGWEIAQSKCAITAFQSIKTLQKRYRCVQFLNRAFMWCALKLHVTKGRGEQMKLKIVIYAKTQLSSYPLSKEGRTQTDRSNPLVLPALAKELRGPSG